MSDQVTNTLDYRGKIITFSVVRDSNVPNLDLWYISAQIDGLLKPLKSKFLTPPSRQRNMELARSKDSAQEYLDTIYEGIRDSAKANCEFLSVDLDMIEIMWYSGGQVEIEQDTQLLILTKSLIDNLLDKSKETEVELMEAGFL